MRPAGGLDPTIPAHISVRVLFYDRGLQNPDLWTVARSQDWHPYLRYNRHMTFQKRKRACTRIVLWVPGQESPGSYSRTTLPTM